MTDVNGPLLEHLVKIGVKEALGVKDSGGDDAEVATLTIRVIDAMIDTMAEVSKRYEILTHMLNEQEERMNGAGPNESRGVYQQQPGVFANGGKVRVQGAQGGGGNRKRGRRKKR